MPAAQAASNDVVRNLLGHRSVRAYLPRAVPDEVLVAAIAAAQSASTSSNLQAWSVVTVTDPLRKARLAALAGKQRHVEEAPLFLAWVLDLSRLRRAGESKREATDGLDYLESFVVGAVDTTLAAQNAAVAFESFGLGLVFIGGMRNRPEAVARELGLPQSSMVLFGMCVGYPDPDQLPAIKPRLPQAVVLHREQYNVAAERGAVDTYDRCVFDYLRERGDAGGTWTDVAVERVRGPEALSGRDRLRDALSGLAFKLL
ncbi:NADPH-dependent oxidoreductase [Burkholderia vietnamiensis]|uniref:NADPH-dependent oxidoreductase n=2 Tax=Burkholderia vietnamiensis TaxID=60552 RepID=A0AAW7SX10_BURVI|nr:NADPH-dependent oxidoreductase [Burkholderia vietnamiensis]MBR8010528.1 NADPH-dependent oxidoreductase [Burkholderia vietnamiensis]MDN7795096.1 NADPH-dependent oxidoreductase [Burkholderia vietnamiensis]HDR9103958.1 NADPH-dependent oxidoreductase [Burkholderia vietnamiensis]